MADRNQLKVADRHGIAEDDPFAELTRIMGFDPRQPVRPQPPAHPVAAEAVDDAFDIDLEKELMGELAGFNDEPAAAASAAIEPPVQQADLEDAAWTDPHAGGAEPVAAEGLAFDAAMDDEIAASLEQDFRTEAYAVAEDEAGPAAVEALDDAVGQALTDEYQFDDRDAENLADAPQDAAAVKSAAYAADAVEYQPHDAESSSGVATATPTGASDDDFAAYFDGAMAHVDMDFAARPGAVQALEPEAPDAVFDGQPLALDDAAFTALDDARTDFVEEPVFDLPAFTADAEEPAVVSEVEQPVFHHPAYEPAAEEADFDGAFESAASDLVAQTSFAAAPRAVPYQPAETAQPSAARDNTLEDELNALLKRMTARPAALDQIQATVAPEAAAARDHDGRLAAADLSAGGAAAQPAHAGEDIDAMLLADLQALDFGDLAAEASPIGMREQEPVRQPQPAADPQWAWGRGTPLAQPAVAPAAFEPRAVAPVAEPVWQAQYQVADTVAPSAPAMASPRNEMPDVETIDVPERVVALADDLDLPELSFEQDRPEAASYDDIDTHFAGLVGEMSPTEPAPATPRAAAYDDDPYVGFSQGQGSAQGYVAAATAMPSGRPVADFNLAGFADSRPLAGNAALAAGELDYDPDLDEANTVPSVAGSEMPPRNRGLLLAAAIGAVAIAGGLGAFALSLGGSGSDAPAIVKADNQPIKVKPENPGGTVIPNQDNKVYEAVNGVKATQPTQQKLVTDAEEPMDVAKSDGAPPQSGVVDMSPAADAAPTPKSEDRIEQAAAPQADAAGRQETALVAPRKVRTMIVRPDGSLVPREDPAPTTVAATEPVDPAPQHVETSIDQTGAVPPAAASQPAAAESNGTAQSSATPSVAPIAPQRPSDQPVNVVGEVKPDQVAAIDQGAVASGAWSMQIASQPTAESAQKTYQDLVRRYGSVLEGHGANIVKAEIAGKGTFYRVRVPTQSRNDAIKLCESYKAAGGNCFVSK